MIDRQWWRHDDGAPSLNPHTHTITQSYTHTHMHLFRTHTPKHHVLCFLLLIFVFFSSFWSNRKWIVEPPPPISSRQEVISEFAIGGVPGTRSRSGQSKNSATLRPDCKSVTTDRCPLVELNKVAVCVFVCVCESACVDLGLRKVTANRLTDRDSAL